MRFGNTTLSRSETITFFIVLILGLLGAIIPGIFAWAVLSEIGFWPVLFVVLAFGAGYFAHWWHSLSPTERAARRIIARRSDDEPYA